MLRETRFAGGARQPARGTSGPDVFAGTDACVTPVLAFGEVSAHPHMAARHSVIPVDGIEQAAPAPRQITRIKFAKQGAAPIVFLHKNQICDLRMSKMNNV